MIDFKMSRLLSLARKRCESGYRTCHFNSLLTDIKNEGHFFNDKMVVDNENFSL